ncbi:MAG: glycosyltransferase [Ruminococcus flavefaciens]|nr:glycosyltransferase [Ruminococcus flavefaciens]
MLNKEKNFISAVVYVHNAGRTIQGFLETLIDVLETNFEYSEIICVNDDSKDDSVKIIKDLSKNTSTASLSVVNMSYFHGLELAMNAGVDLSIGDFVFEFDTTFPDYAPDEIMRVYRRSLEGYDIVSAVSDRREKIFSRIFYAVFDRYANLTYKMHTESFRILSRRVINHIASMNKTVPYRKAIYATQGLRTDQLNYKSDKNVSVTYDRQLRGYRSSLAVDSLILFTGVGYRFSMTMTILMMLMSVFMIIYTIVVYVTLHPVAGWTTTILFLSMAFFGLFGILTIIVKYLQIIVDLVFKRKHYSFENIEKLTK